MKRNDRTTHQKSTTPRSLLIVAAEEYARLIKLVSRSAPHQFNRFHSIWSRIEAAEHAVLTARATMVSEAAVQAHLLLCGIECLEVEIEGDEINTKSRSDDKRRLEMAAQSLRYILASLAGDAQPLEYRKGGFAEASDSKFMEA